MTTPAPALLGIPVYDYILLEMYMDDTHTRREGRKNVRNYHKNKREAVRCSSLSIHPPPVRGVSKSLYTFTSCDTMTSIKYSMTATVPPTYGGAVFAI